MLLHIIPCTICSPVTNDLRRVREKTITYISTKKPEMIGLGPFHKFC